MATLTVRDLISKLSELPLDAPVGTIDSDGNELDIVTAWFHSDPRYNGQFDRVLLTVKHD